MTVIQTSSEELIEYLHGKIIPINIHVIPEPRTCKKFGCGKVLSRQECLFGDTCIHCQGCKRVDINDVMDDLDDLDDLKFE